ncbi:MAG: bifunctional nuclease family protein [Bdellovibrionota bacterium]
MRREAEIAALTLDPSTNSPVVVLREKGGADQIPIWIGFVEASAIAMELERIKVARPLTHDLLKNVITTLESQLVSIEVSDLKDNTYFAKLQLNRQGNAIEVDSRPSDAIALAVRFGAPIFINEKVFEASSRRADEEPIAAEAGDESDLPAERVPQGGEDPLAALAQFREENREKWDELLEQLDPTKLSKQ